MRTFSIDLLSEEIKNPKTKEYFEEVSRSYYAGNYRSAIVMLYSVVICDLVYKLKELHEHHNDTVSREILQEVEDIQSAKQNSPDWENKLLELIKERTKILEAAALQNITHLQKHRHLCAHPVLLEDYKLYSPNRETVRAHIVNILNELLTKPALLSKKILTDFLHNLSEIKNILITEEDLQVHLESKYFNNLNTAVEQDIFKSLWKLIFKLDNSDCDENRIINFRTLNVLLKRDYQNLLEFIEAEKAYFSNNIDFKFFDALFKLLVKYPQILQALSNSAQTLIRNTIEANPNYLFGAWFLNGTIEKHLTHINEWIDGEAFDNSIAASA
jgi:hypothetical protein